MGRKKLPIKLIESDKSREVPLIVTTQITFCKRKVGLLKKAKEISILCGSKVSLLLTDQQGDVVSFETSKDFVTEVRSKAFKKYKGKKRYIIDPSYVPIYHI